MIKLYCDIMDNDLKIIKNKYGEEMMHLCKKIFSTILEYPNRLPKLLEDNFYPSKSLYTDLIKNDKIYDFEKYIYSLFNEKKELLKTDKTPFELMEEAGYILYECRCEREINFFKKYYKKGEELCTFKEDRLKDCHVFFAVKKDVNDIKREDYKCPFRQDDYGVSVISIQFTKGDYNGVSIKNRYNHKVKNPDATFCNNLDNIIPGLTYSFYKMYHYNLELTNNINFELDGYKRDENGKYYKIFYSINNTLYGPNNIIIDNGKLQEQYLQLEKYIIADYFIVDLMHHKVILYDEKISDSFIDGIKDIEKIEPIRNKRSGVLTLNITCKDNKKIVIKLNKDNNIIEYNNGFLKNIGNNFMHKCLFVKKVDLENTLNIGDNFICCSDKLTSFNADNLETIGNAFLLSSKNIKKLILDNVKSIGNYFLFFNTSLKELSLKSLMFIDNNYLFSHKNKDTLLSQAISNKMYK